MFSLEKESETGNQTCRLGGPKSQLELDVPGINSTLYYDRKSLINALYGSLSGRVMACTPLLPWPRSGALVPERYSFAMVTSNHIHFLLKLDGPSFFSDASTLCKANGGGHLVMDNQGQAWHERIAESMIYENSWLGAEDKDENKTYTWVDG